VGRRPHIKRVANLCIPLDTPRHKLERAVEIIEELLKDHEGMRLEFPPRVYFTEFEEEAFNICMIYWYAPPTTGTITASARRSTLGSLPLLKQRESPSVCPPD